jgi:hypothetical protein
LVCHYNDCLLQNMPWIWYQWIKGRLNQNQVVDDILNDLISFKLLK